MTIPFNPSLIALSVDPSFPHTGPGRRIMLNPPDDFISTSMAQQAIAAGQAPAPFAEGPILFSPSGQAVMAAPPPGEAQGSWTQPDVVGAQGAQGGDIAPGSGLGMGVSTYDQQGLDQAWMDEIASQLAAGMPGQSAQTAQTGQQSQAQQNQPAPAESQDQPQTQSQTPADDRTAQSPVQAPVNEGEDTAFTIATAAPVDPSALSPTLESIASLAETATIAATPTTGVPSASATLTGTDILVASASPSDNSSASSPVSASASASPAPSSDASADNAGHSKPFTQSVAFILLMVLCSLALFGIIATALRWILRWRSKDGKDRYLGGLLASRRRDVEEDDLSDIVRSFGSTPATSRRGSGNPETNNGEYDYEYGTGGVEKRSSLLAEEMGRSPFLHSNSNTQHADGMENIDLGDDERELGIPRMGCASTRGSDGSPLFGSDNEYQKYGTVRLEVRNPSSYDDHEGEMSAADRARTLPRSWVAERALANIAGWSRTRSSNSIRSSSLNSDASLPSPFSQHGHNHPSSPSGTALVRDSENGSESDWPRSASQCSSESASTVGGPGPRNANANGNENEARSSTWASNLRSSLFAAISGGTKLEEDKFTRPILPLHTQTLGRVQGRNLSRASSLRSSSSRSSRLSRSSLGGSSERTLAAPVDAGTGAFHTFGRGSKGLVIEEEDEKDDDEYSLTSSAKGDLRRALLLGEKSASVSRNASTATTSTIGGSEEVSGKDKTRPLKVGERYKAYARSLRDKQDDEVDLLPAGGV